jgi:hypothetical protein
MKVDCEEILKNTDKMIKSVKYHINTVISNGECHTDLYNDSTVQVEVIEATPIYLKTHCKGLNSPATFSVKYLCWGDMKIWTSTNNQMPSAHDCNRQFGKQRQFVIWNEGREKAFGNDNIYITLYSNVGVSVEIRVRYDTRRIGKNRGEIWEEIDPEEELRLFGIMTPLEKKDDIVKANVERAACFGQQSEEVKAIK